MSVASYLSAISRRCVPGLLWVALGCGAACAILPKPRIMVKTLTSGSTVVDSRGVVFDLPAAATAERVPSVCMILDTLEYEFRPRAEGWRPLRLTDTTLYARNAVAQSATPIVLKAVLYGENGKRADADWGNYVPGNELLYTDSLYNRVHQMTQAGEIVCLGWTVLPGNVTYKWLHLGSTRPIVVHELTWHYPSGS